MKIIFTSAEKNGAGFIFYSSSLSKINKQFNNVSLDVSFEPEKVDYTKYDVALFMGYDEKSRIAKLQNKKIMTGVVDPRGGQKIDFSDIDFIITNGIEAKDYFSPLCDNALIYYTYPTVLPKQECPFSKDKLILGYHGNKIHLDAMMPRVTDALEKLNKEIPLELWAMYNVEKLGKWNKKFSFEIKHIQYSEENYAKYIAHSDVGLVPQLIPVTRNKVMRYLIGSFKRKYNERSRDFIMRFKDTTNIGRHLVFAQYGIPVISDMAPSSCGFIKDGEDSFLAFHTGSWFSSLKKLAKNKSLRKRMGEQFYDKYIKQVHHDIQNQRLVDFIEEIKKEQPFD